MRTTELFSRKSRHGFGLLIALAGLLGGATPAWSSQLNNAGATGTTGANATSTKTYPSGLTVSYAVTGANYTITANNVPLTTLGGSTSAMFTPPVPTTTTGIQLTNAAPLGSGCSYPTTAARTLACTNRGTMTISFSRPVTNPILHLQGMGGNLTVVGDPVSITSNRTVHVLTGSVPAGATLTQLAGSVNLTLTGNTLDLTNPSFAGTSCSTPTPPATQLAGCGSVRINGTVTSVTFRIDLNSVRNTSQPQWNELPGDDGYMMTVSVDEDFGDAPATYDAVAAASHIIDGLRLGATVDLENPNVFNGTPAVTPSPNAIAAGGDNNGAAGDGADENGLTAPLATLHTGLIGQTYSLSPTLSGGTAAGTVCGWVDFNRNGVFETAEGVCNAVASGATTTTLNWTVPIATVAGRSYVRLRATQGTQLTTATPTGRVDSGEVEDYMIEIKPTVRVVKLLSPTTNPGLFDLSIGGTVFAAGAGHNGTTNFRTLYHNSASGAPDLTVAQNITTTAITTTASEAPAAGNTGVYATTYACVNGAGTAVATGTGTSVNLTLPVSVTGAAANGRAQSITCTFTNRATAANLSITKSDSNPGYTPGGTATYTLQACNAAGADAASNAAISDTLPAGVTLSAPWTCTGTGGGVCSAASGGTAGGNVVSLTATTLPAGACLNILVPVSFSADPAAY